MTKLQQFLNRLNGLRNGINRTILHYDNILDDTQLNFEFERRKQEIMMKNYNHRMSELIPILRHAYLVHDGYLKPDAQLICEAQMLISTAKQMGVLDQLNCKVEKS
jgi:hypothetical protein